MIEKIMQINADIAIGLDPTLLLVVGCTVGLGYLTYKILSVKSDPVVLFRDHIKKNLKDIVEKDEKIVNERYSSSELEFDNFKKDLVDQLPKFHEKAIKEPSTAEQAFNIALDIFNTMFP